MELKQYRTMIKNQLLEGLYKKANKDHNIESGFNYDYKPHDYDNLVRRMSRNNVPQIRMDGVPDAHYNTDDDDEITGGKIDFKKMSRTASNVMKKQSNKMGNIIKQEGKTIGKSFKEEGLINLNKYANEGKKYIKDRGMGALNSIETYDDEDDAETGGKIDFKKMSRSVGNSIKKQSNKMGNIIQQEAKQVGRAVKDEGMENLNKYANEGKKYIKDRGMNALNSIDTGEAVGGKIHFIKSMKKLGNKMQKGMTSIGSEIGHDVLNNVAQQGMEYVKNEAPMMLMAGGVKQKRTRTVSAKEAGRHRLIKELMQKHKCTLAEASSHIKQNQLKY